MERIGSWKVKAQLSLHTSRSHARVLGSHLCQVCACAGLVQGVDCPVSHLQIAAFQFLPDMLSVTFMQGMLHGVSPALQLDNIARCSTNESTIDSLPGSFSQSRQHEGSCQAPRGFEVVQR